MDENKRGTARTVGTMMLLTLLGKVLGLLRDMRMGHVFATGAVSDAFLAASRIPRNFFDAVFASAISASFIPIFNEYLEKKGREEAFRLANVFLTVTALATALMSVLGMVFAEPLTALLASGFDEPTAALCAKLLCILFPTVLFTGVAFSIVGVLQSLGEFRIPALLSAVSNGAILLYFFTLCDRFGVVGLAWAYLVGWGLQVVVQFPALRRAGFCYRPALRHEGLRKIFTLMLPVMASTWVQPFNLMVATRYASRISGGASAMEYANTLYTIISGVFVLSVANVVFPELSRLSARREEAQLGESLKGTLRVMLFFLAPMTAGLCVMARPLVRLLYEWGEWSEGSTALTAGALALLSLGMVAYGLQIILSRAYYADQRGKMPLVSGLVGVGVNLVLCALLSPSMGVSGLALASSLSSLCGALVLLVPLSRRYGLLRGEGGELLRTALATAAMTAVVWLLRAALEARMGASLLSRVVVMMLPTLAGVAVFFTLAWLLRVRALRDLKELLKKKGADAA